MGDRKAFFTSIDAAPQSALAHGRGRILHLVDPSTGSHRLDVHVNLINDDSGPGEVHFHAHADNVYIVLDGMLEVVVDGERHILGKHDIGFIPAGLVHTAGSLGGHGPTRIIEIYAPAGEDFHEVESFENPVEIGRKGDG